MAIVGEDTRWGPPDAPKNWWGPSWKNRYPSLGVGGNKALIIMWYVGEKISTRWGSGRGGGRSGNDRSEGPGDEVGTSSRWHKGVGDPQNQACGGVEVDRKKFRCRRRDGFSGGQGDVKNRKKLYQLEKLEEISTSEAPKGIPMRGHGARPKYRGGA